MGHLTPGDRIRLARLSADRSRRAAVAGLLGSPLLRWRYGAPLANALLFAPQDLRTSDPSFAGELEFGHFGLAGAVAFLGARSPFDVTPPSDGWARELAGFGWLRHLTAAGHAKARTMALGLVLSCIDREPVHPAVDWQPDVLGRRIISWLANSRLLLDDVEGATYDRITDSLGDQLIRLSASWRAARDGYPRLLALIALTMADLCIEGRERHLDAAEGWLVRELDRQVHADGGHISRNPAVLVELLLDLLPLSKCFTVRNRKAPPAVAGAIERIFPMLRHLRLGDGTLARFNGVSGQTIDLMATVIAYDERPDAVITDAPQSRYLRLARESTVVILDGGGPPELELAGAAHAGCLSFEMSAGPHAIFINGGAPGPSDQDWTATARATASHNTLSLDGRSSSRLVEDARLEELAGGYPIRLPDGVVAAVTEKAGQLELEAHHNGYLPRYKLLHRRRLTLSADGQRLHGLDRLAPTRGQLRLARDLPFAIHFHLHPAVDCRMLPADSAAELTLGDGSRWRFSAKGAQVAIEESIQFADLAGPRRTLQLTLRATCPGESEVDWCVVRSGDPEARTTRAAD